MRRRHTTQPQLQRELAGVNEKITEHPSASKRIRTANALVEAKKAEDATHDQINGVLEEQGLPRLEEIGKTPMKGLFSWWRLYRERRKIEHKLSRTDA